MSTNEQQNAGLDLLLHAHGLDPIGHFFISESLRHIQDEEKLHSVEFVVFYGGGGSKGHFNMWNPVFEQQKDRFLSIFRGTRDWWEIREHENVVPIAAHAQIEILLDRLPNLKAVLYPGNYNTNLHALRQSHLQHIFIGHGDSNKSSSAHKVFRVYDEVWVAGQAHVDRFLTMPFDVSGFNFRVVGQPWMKETLENLLSDAESSIDWCYFPTWKGSTSSQHYSSLDKFEEFHVSAFQQLPVNFRGLIKPHPLIQDEELLSLSGLVQNNAVPTIDADAGHNATKRDDGFLSLSPADMSISQAFSRGPKFVVCDISAAVTECLFLNVPIFLFNPSNQELPEQKIRDLYPGCYIFKDAEELKRLLTDVILQDNDTLSSAREEMLAYTVDIEKTKNNAVFQELDRISSSYPSQFNHDLTEPQSLAARM